MRLTKLVHSCLIVESEGKKALVDPGNYSWQSGIILPDVLGEIDYIIVTHAHPDHLDPQFAAVINDKSPNALWYGPPEVVSVLKTQGIDGSSTSELSDVKFIPSKHANLHPWMKQQPDHTSFVLFKDLLISGDHQDFSEMHGAKYLAGAFTAPWGSIVAGAQMIERMNPRPEKYIPVHDWHLNDTHREAAYGQAEEVFGQFGVSVVKPTNGEPFEI